MTNESGAKGLAGYVPTDREVRRAGKKMEKKMRVSLRAPKAGSKGILGQSRLARRTLWRRVAGDNVCETRQDKPILVPSPTQGSDYAHTHDSLGSMGRNLETISVGTEQDARGIIMHSCPI